jgi:hypothetical protein
MIPSRSSVLVLNIATRWVGRQMIHSLALQSSAVISATAHSCRAVGPLAWVPMNGVCLLLRSLDWSGGVATQTMANFSATLTMVRTPTRHRHLWAALNSSARIVSCAGILVTAFSTTHFSGQDRTRQHVSTTMTRPAPLTRKSGSCHPAAS